MDLLQYDASPYLAEFPMSLLTLILMFAGPVNDLPPASDLLDQTIAWHDPDNLWPTFNHTLQITETRPKGRDRKTQVTLNVKAGNFVYSMEDGQDKIFKSHVDGACKATLNGSSEFSEELSKKHRMSCEQIKWYQNYYLYMWGLPMKLKDQGTILDPVAQRGTFLEKEALILKITYDPEVGGDVWYFYLDPKTKALLGCRFYHDESKNEGEYITFEGEYRLESMRIPKTRAWYMNDDGDYLGSDSLTHH